MDLDSETYLGWCPEVVEVLDEETNVDVVHVCRHDYDHDGMHQCQGCGVKWDMEVPC